MKREQIATLATASVRVDAIPEADGLREPTWNQQGAMQEFTWPLKIQHP